MIRPLLRKDLALHWMAALAVPVFYAAINAVAVFYSNQQAVEVMSIPFYVAGFYLLTALVQGDPIPGDHADWLIRPIHRHHLLAAKLLFVALVFLLPMITVDVFLPFLLGFGADRVFGAATGHLISVFAGLILPTMAIAAATSNIAQCVVGGVLAGFAYSLLMPMLPWSVERDSASLSWIEDIAVLAIAFVVSAVVLCLQYFGRKTRWSYGMATAGFLATAAVAHVPLRKAWDFQAQLRPAGAFEEGMQLKPDSSGFYLRSGSPLVVHIPVEVQGRNLDNLLFPERASLRLRFSNGQVREAESRDLRGVNFENGRHHFIFDFGLDPELYELRDILAEPEISLYWLAFDPLKTHEFDTEKAFKVVPEAGRCRTARDKEAIVGECMQVGDDSPFTNLNFESGYKRWIEISLDRLSPMFVRFGATVLSWKSRLVPQETVTVDLSQAVPTGDHRFQRYKAPVQLKTVELRGILARKIQLPQTRFSRWRFQARD